MWLAYQNSFTVPCVHGGLVEREAHALLGEQDALGAPVLGLDVRVGVGHVVDGTNEHVLIFLPMGVDAAGSRHGAEVCGATWSQMSRAASTDSSMMSRPRRSSSSEMGQCRQQLDDLVGGAGGLHQYAPVEGLLADATCDLAVGQAETAGKAASLDEQVVVVGVARGDAVEPALDIRALGHGGLLEGVVPASRSRAPWWRSRTPGPTPRKRSVVLTGLPDVQLRADQGQRHGQAVPADRLGQGDHVRDDPCLLEAEEAAGPCRNPSGCRPRISRMPCVLHSSDSPRSQSRPRGVDAPPRPGRDSTITAAGLFSPLPASVSRRSRYMKSGTT
jgi:hypothetical protein